LTAATPAASVSADGPSRMEGEKGSRCESSQCRRCPRNCERRACAGATGNPREGGDWAATREPGDLPSPGVLWRRRRGGVHRTGASL